jgi:hypothetical protein
VDEGCRKVYFAWNLQHIAHGSGDPDQGAGDNGGPCPLSIGGEWA